MNGFRSLVAANLLGTIGALTIVILPGIVGVIAESLQLSAEQVGIVVSADLITMAAAMGVTALIIHKSNRRLLALAGLALLLAGTLLSIGAESSGEMCFARLIAGVGEGVAVSVAFAIFGGTQDPDRQFAIYLVVILSAAAATLYLIPVILSYGGKGYVFGVIGALVVLTAFFVPWLPASHADGTDESRSDYSNVPILLVSLGLVTVFFYFMAQGEAWAFMERIATDAGLPGSTIGTSLALSNIGGIAGAATAALLSLRFGRALPIIVSAIISSIGLLVLLGEITALSFGLATMLYIYGWNLTQPYFSGIMAELDPKGRAVVMMGAIQTAGVGLGPAAVGMMIKGGNFDAVSYFGLFLIAISLLSVLTLLFLKQRQPPQ